MNKEKYILKLNIWELQVITSLTNHCIDCAIEEKGTEKEIKYKKLLEKLMELDGKEEKEILDCLSYINKEINFKNKRGF